MIALLVSLGITVTSAMGKTPIYLVNLARRHFEKMDENSEILNFTNTVHFWRKWIVEILFLHFKSYIGT